MLQKLEKFDMSKSTITRLFEVAVAFVVAGSASGTAVAIWALANGAVTLGGSSFVTFNPATLAGAIVGLVIASILTGVGTITAIVSWVGALANTARLEDKTWFTTLLVSGLVSFGWLAMIAYILRGPDSTSAEAPAAA